MQREIPQAGQFYRHFKNKLYQIVTLATHSETNETLVIYQALYGDFKVYARPLDMFLSPVDKVKYPDVKQTWRFQRVSFAEKKSISVSETKSPQETQSSTSVSSSKLDTPAKQASTYVERLEQAVTAFLDAPTYTQKLQVLENYQMDSDKHMLDSMAYTIDHSLSSKTVEEKYEELHHILQTLIHFESSRLRF